MKLKLVKEMIEKTLDTEGVEVLNTISVDYNIQEADEIIGSVNISQYGVNFNLYGSNYDIDEWKTKINNLLVTK